MEYEADTVVSKIDDYASRNLKSLSATGSLIATHDGNRTVTLGVG
jgi:hypothetical protein